MKLNRSSLLPNRALANTFGVADLILVGAALLHLKKASSPRNMNNKHTLLFNPLFARSLRAHSHKV
jgi:hypothetical protein